MIGSILNGPDQSITTVQSAIERCAQRDHRSVLLVLQGMDTSGKGGIVKHVVGQVDPQGMAHASFGVPTEDERKHHYLWRIRNALPSGGQLGVFDRSHYEDVLVVRVHNLVAPEVWGARYKEINAFEKELTEAGTTILKVVLVVSLDEQKRRLAERLDRPDKYWKFNPNDIDERAFWPAYQDAYQAVLEKTSTAHAPGMSYRVIASGTAGWRSPHFSTKRWMA